MIYRFEMFSSGNLEFNDETAPYCITSIDKTEILGTANSPLEIKSEVLWTIMILNRLWENIRDCYMT